MCTPAGFGKTTLLADWARGTPRPVAWVSLDEGDNDPTRFWRHVAAALDRVRPGLGERAGALLRDAGRASFEAVPAMPEPQVLDQLTAKEGTRGLGVRLSWLVGRGVGGPTATLRLPGFITSLAL